MVPIYKGVSEQAGAKIKESRIMIIQINGRLDSRKALKMKDPLEDDVMKVFCVFKR